MPDRISVMSLGEYHSGNRHLKGLAKSKCERLIMKLRSWKSGFCSLLIVAAMLLTMGLRAAEITVAAAADLKFALDRIGHGIPHESTGHQSQSHIRLVRQLLRATPKPSAVRPLFFGGQLSIRASYPKPDSHSTRTFFSTPWAASSFGRRSNHPWTWEKLGIQSLLAPSVKKNRGGQSNARALWPGGG